MDAKEREEGGGAGGDYISNSTVKARRRTRCTNWKMTWINQKMNGEKEDKTRRMKIRKIRSRRLGRFSP